MRGRCASDLDCRAGSSCTVGGLCIAQSGVCEPACASGQLCSSGSCQTLKPSLRVAVEPNMALSASHDVVVVHVDAAPAIALGTLMIVVDKGGTVASGSAPAAAGDDTVTLTGFTAGTVGTASISARLDYSVAGQSDTAQSVAVPVFVDTVPPQVTVFVPVTSDAKNGWVARTADLLEVRAQADDGTGTGAAAARLTFDACPAGVPCSYDGTKVSQSGGVTTFSFQVPRTAQAAGAESPLAVTVTATDGAGNPGAASAQLQIDDAPPQLAAVNLIGAVTGEDGHAWFPGGTSAPEAQLALSVVDAGSGVQSVALHLEPADTASGVALDYQPVPSNDGLFHFQIPAAAVQHREGRLRFTVKAIDQLQHERDVSGTDSTSLWLDDVPPVVSGLTVDYAGAQPPLATVCNATGWASTSFTCGRGGGDHLLRDDTATVSFDVTDCGAGVGAPSASVTSGGAGPTALGVTETGASASSCANPTHHYQFTLAPQAALDAPDASGTSYVHLAANGLDRAGHDAGAATDAAVSLWRWKAQLRGAPAGAPSLAPGTAGARSVAVPTTAPSGTGANLFVVNADGSLSVSVSVGGGIGSDVLTGTDGTLWTTSPASCSGASCGLSAVSGGAAALCPATTAALGLPPMLGANNNADLVWAVSGGSTGTLYSAQLASGACKVQANRSISPAGGLTGISGAGTRVFVGTGTGFTSYDQSSADVNSNSAAPFTSSRSAASGAPSIASGGGAFFGAPDGLHLAALVSGATNCVPYSSCWKETWARAAAFDNKAGGESTPVFDDKYVYAADTSGTIYMVGQSNGARAATLTPTASGLTMTAPVLLSGYRILSVQSDGQVRLFSVADPTNPSSASLLTVAAGAAVPPVIDVRGAGSIAYVPDAQGQLWALQLPAAPLNASQNAWPRPGRDSCNTRNASSTCP